MDSAYIQSILNSMDKKSRGKVLTLVEKDHFQVNGYRSLTSVPNGHLANMFMKNSASVRSLLKHTCEVFFGIQTGDGYSDCLKLPIEDKALIPAYLAAYAMQGQEDGEEAQRLLREASLLEVLNETAVAEAPADTNESKQTAHRQAKKEGNAEKEKTMKLLGFVKQFKNNYRGRDYFNFVPTHDVDENGKIIPIEDASFRFPNEGRIFLYTIGSDDLLYDNFIEKQLYVISVKEFEENRSNVTLNKLNAKNLIHNNQVEDVRAYNIYYVVTPSISGSAVDFSRDIYIDKTEATEGEHVLLRNEQKLYGPFRLQGDNNGNLFIRADLKANNYIVNTYACKYSLDDKIKEMKCGFEIDEVRDYYKSAVQLDDDFTAQESDFIPDEILFDKLADWTTSKSGCVPQIAQQIKELGQTDISASPLLVYNNPELTEQRYKKLAALVSNADILKRNSERFIALLKEILLKEYNQGLHNYDFIYNGILNDEELVKIIPQFGEAKTKIDKLHSEIKALESKKLELEKESYDKALEQNEQLKQSITEQEAKLKVLEEKNTRYETLEEMNGAIKWLEDKKYKLERENESLARENDKVKDKIKSAIHDVINTQDLSSSIAKSISTDYMSRAIIEASAQEAKSVADSGINDQIEVLKTLKLNTLKDRALIDDICAKISEYRPDYKKNDILNILICYTQGFLTVFSGEPGTGKTSICRILGHVLGLDGISKTGDGCINRFLTVSVEKGWTSKRDLIGYYNPLTKSFDSSNSLVYNSLKILDRENTESLYPMTVLLDEANLSPIEYYWADFMSLCDGWSENNVISLGNNEVLKIPKTLRFLATINNDFTTELLSPRLIDRAWVIILPTFTNNASKQLNLCGANDIVPWQALENAFTPKADCELSGLIRKTLDEVYTKLKPLNVPLSPRTNQAIRKYCAVAQSVFEGGELADLYAVDYAIAQKLLTKINGNGADYHRDLTELCKYFRDHSLTHSAEILDRIIKNGVSMMNYFKFF